MSVGGRLHNFSCPNGAKYSTIFNMNIKKAIISVSNLKVESQGILGSVEENRRPIVITQSGKTRAALMNIDSYEQQKNLVLLLKI